jgi:hypothetical protein
MGVSGVPSSAPCRFIDDGGGVLSPPPTGDRLVLEQLVDRGQQRLPSRATTCTLISRRRG